MKIHVNRVPETGLTEHAVYDPQPLDMERADVRLAKPFEVDAAISLIDSELVVKADIHAQLTCLCARCLEEFAQPVELDGIFSYSVKPTDVVDITDDVRQEIILAYPMIPHCSRDCKGLCAVCGKNLNRESCEHQEASEKS